MQYVKVEVVGETLTLGIEEDVNLLFPKRLVFSLDVDDLSILAIAGLESIESNTLITEDLNLAVSGSGEIDLAGGASVKEVSIGGSGSVNYYGKPLISTSVSGSRSLNSLGEKSRSRLTTDPTHSGLPWDGS